MPPFVVFILVLAGIWTLSGISTWLNKQKEAERRQRLREQMARAGVNVPIAPPVVSQTPRQISAGIAQRFPDVLLAPSPQRQPQKIQQRRPQGPRRVQPRPARGPGAPGFGGGGVQRAQQPARPQAPAMVTPMAPPAMVSTPAPVTPAVSAPGRTAAQPRMTAASLSRWLSPRTLNQQFLLSEIFQPPVGMRDHPPGM